jgi:microcompartment protein CcmK/EutM
MFLAVVMKRVVSTRKHPAYAGKTVFVIRPVNPDGSLIGEESVAMDAVGAGVGDTVVCGGAPGAAKEVFDLERAPIRTLIMAVVDEIRSSEFGNRNSGT